MAQEKLALDKQKADAEAKRLEDARIAKAAQDKINTDKQLADAERLRKEREAINKLKDQQTAVVKTEAPVKEVDYANEEEKKKYLSSLAQKYGEGYHKEVIKEEKRVLTRIVIVKGAEVSEYKMLKYDWGGLFYFKNGVSISGNNFNIETKEPK